MADNQHNKANNGSDEIDLGQLFHLIGRGFNSVFRGFLRLFLYLKRNALLLLGLVVVGLAIGYGLNQIISKKLKTEVIVKPQMESKNYLYDVIDEVQANIRARDTAFFAAIGIEGINFKGLEVSVNRVLEEGTSETDMKYLELLQSFENTDAIADILRAELQNKSSFNHRITFVYKDSQSGTAFAAKIMEYINSNVYFDGMVSISRENAESRIQQNQVLLKQVDEIILNYTNNLANKNGNVVSERIILDNKEQVNIADLFQYKNLLIRDIETKKLELAEQTEPISVINFGKPQIVQKSFFGKKVVFVPLLLVGLFFIVSLLTYLNEKSKTMTV